jgi:hypothetical protein
MLSGTQGLGEGFAVHLGPGQALSAFRDDKGREKSPYASMSTSLVSFRNRTPTTAVTAATTIGYQRP